MIYILVIYLLLFNITFGLLPPSPGPIQQDQLSQEPIVAYVGSTSATGFFPLRSNCANYYQYLDRYLPVVALNDTALLVYKYNDINKISIAIITSNGTNELQVPSIMQSDINEDLSNPYIFYDDKLNIYLYLDSHNTVNQINIDENSRTKSGFPNINVNYKTVYYDLTSSTLYFTGVNLDTQLFLILTHQILSPDDSKTTFYDLETFNLQIEINQIQVSGYQNTLILFGVNIQTQKSYLYQLDLSSLTSTLLGENDYSSTFIIGVNPRYVSLISSTKTSMQLFDLLTGTVTGTFSDICAVTLFSRSFLSSIVLKDIFITYNH